MHAIINAPGDFGWHRPACYLPLSSAMSSRTGVLPCFIMAGIVMPRAEIVSIRKHRFFDASCDWFPYLSGQQKAF